MKLEADIDNLIVKTSKLSTLKAMNLNNLLKKKWSEEPNAYKLMSKIDTKKEARIKELLNH